LINADDLTKVYLLAEVSDLTQLNYLMTKLGNLSGVRDVRRQNWR
jgi:transcriptional regulator of aromatic amino acid metabolism